MTVTVRFPRKRIFLLCIRLYSAVKNEKELKSAVSAVMSKTEKRVMLGQAFIRLNFVKGIELLLSKPVS